MPTKTLAVGTSRKMRGFCPMLLTKADGRVFAFIPAPYGHGLERWLAKRHARRWAKTQSFDKAFIDTRRRNGTTYWKEIRL